MVCAPALTGSTIGFCRVILAAHTANPSLPQCDSVLITPLILPRTGVVERNFDVFFEPQFSCSAWQRPLLPHAWMRLAEPKLERLHRFPFASLNRMVADTLDGSALSLTQLP